MAIRKFLTSVADVYGYDQDDQILFTAKTLLDSSIEVSLGSNPVRGGRGNQLQYVYYHTGEMNFTLTDAQWNLGLLSATVGSDINHTDSVYVEDEVVLGVGGIATATKGTPLAFEGTAVHGWSTASDGTITLFDFDGQDSSTSLGTQGEVVCLRYYIAGMEAGEVNSFTVESNMIPKVVKLVMEAQLNSADVSTNRIGIVQIIAPRVTLSGAFSISMTADGVSNTPLKGMALAYVDPAGTVGCATEPYYAKMIEIIDQSNWYDNVSEISIAGGNITVANSVANTSNVATLEVWATPYGINPAWVVPNSYLSFESNHTANFTVGANTGIVTLAANASNNTADIKVSVAGKPALTDTIVAKVVNA